MKRRATGLALVLAAGAIFACSHDAKPAQPEAPPLPPASGTPIGYLVDDATELKLTDTQLAHLKSIDDDLATKLASLDGELRGASPSAPQNPGRRRGRGGGMRGGRGGGMRGNPGAGSGAGSGSANPPPRRARPDVTARVTEERAARVREAISLALNELDVVQRIVARRVLTEHGVDVDAGPPSQAKPGTPESTEPTEPDEEPDSGDSGGSNGA